MAKKGYKNLIFFILIIVFVAVVSGCGRKEETHPLPLSRGEQTPPALSSEIAETATSSFEIAEIATSTAEVDTSEWKTYRNEEYGFEIKHPKEFKISEEYQSIRFSESEGECAKDINFAEIDYNEKMEFIEKYACLALAVDSFKTPYGTISLDDLLAKENLDLAPKNERIKINSREVIVSEFFLENGDPYAINAFILGNKYYYEIKMGGQYFFVTEELKNKFYKFLDNFKIL